jgi:hypothetical protein
MMFALELDRRLRAAGARTLSVACHPGYAATNLQSVASAMGGSKLTGRLLAFTNRAVAQSATMGALPTVYAATANDVAGGDLIGPDGFFEMSGYPVKVKPSKRARDEKAGAELWRRSEDLTSVRFEL